MQEIPNSKLVLSDVPLSEVDWERISEFALTYDGYKECGSYEACADIANSRRHESLHDLRACLYFEQRRWHHIGDEPDPEEMAYIRSLVNQIRERVAVQNMNHG